jgi:hypothetical protein
MQWIEIPEVNQENFAMSSIFTGERKGEDASASTQVPVSVSGRLSRASRLRYQTYFYNAARKANASDVAVRVQVLRDGQPVLVMAETKLPLSQGADLSRIPLSGELALGQLPAGRYVLQISATAQESGKSISQQIDFIVE